MAPQSAKVLGIAIVIISVSTVHYEIKGIPFLLLFRVREGKGLVGGMDPKDDSAVSPLEMHQEEKIVKWCQHTQSNSCRPT
eukprot:3449259-Amphidinium_carterae.1